MKLIGSWKDKYIGIQRKNGMCYYMNWVLKPYRTWGYQEDYYDGPLKSFYLWFIAFQWHYDRWED